MTSSIEILREKALSSASRIKSHILDGGKFPEAILNEENVYVPFFELSDALGIENISVETFSRFLPKVKVVAIRYVQNQHAKAAYYAPAGSVVRILRGGEYVGVYIIEKSGNARSPSKAEEEKLSDLQFHETSYKILEVTQAINEPHPEVNLPLPENIQEQTHLGYVEPDSGYQGNYDNDSFGMGQYDDDDMAPFYGEANDYTSEPSHVVVPSASPVGSKKSKQVTTPSRVTPAEEGVLNSGSWRKYGEAGELFVSSLLQLVTSENELKASGVYGSIVKVRTGIPRCTFDWDALELAIAHYHDRFKKVIKIELGDERFYACYNYVEGRPKIANTYGGLVGTTFNPLPKTLQKNIEKLVLPEAAEQQKADIPYAPESLDMSDEPPVRAPRIR